MSDVYFDNKKLPRPKRQYVAFIDIMGTKARMNKSVQECANYIFKFHSAVISSWREKPYKNVFVYPVMDGVYITTAKREDMENIVLRIFRYLCDGINSNNDINYLYVVRGAIAYGEVTHGHSVPYDASKAFEMNLGYKDNILLGKAMIDAYANEDKAAPFGIYIHESAIKQNDDKKRQSGSFPPNWKWFQSEKLKIEAEMVDALVKN